MSYSNVTHAAWSALTAYLEQRSRDLCDEVRHYPTPIAHCDEQLPGLIEQRTRAIARFRQAAECDPAQPGGRERLQAFLAATGNGIDDETELALRAALQAVLGLDASSITRLSRQPLRAMARPVSRSVPQHGNRP